MAISEIFGGTLFHAIHTSAARRDRPRRGARADATACGPSEDNAADKPAADSSGGKESGSLSDGPAETLKKHGVDLEKWKNGEWKNWAP
ncbi:hypothetical protein ACFRQM_23720 [Streptomyces sp. NPDC056831]|uniref:hypothetical protein n=1 Tax=Streptomyces sp. NPDC056831 TaxID=3345954 RepID=UPI003680C7C0